MLYLINLFRILLKIATTLFLVASLLFVFFDLVPKVTSDQKNQQPTSTEKLIEPLNRAGGMLVRYVDFINNLSPVGYTSSTELFEAWNVLVSIRTGEGELALKWPYLGISMHDRRPVGDMILDGLPETLILVLSSLLCTGLISIPLGVIAAKARQGWLDRFVRVLNAFGLAIPSFVAAMFLAWSIGYMMNDFFGLPVTGNLFVYNVYLQQEELILAHLILPMLALSVRPICVSTQLMRSSMVEVLDHNYIRTARAKGLPEYKVLLKHALVNALIPVFGAFTGWLSALMAGAMFVEFVFGFKGIGSLLLSAIEHQDFTVITGVTLLIASVYVITDEVVKVIIVFLNPKLAQQ